MEDSVLHRKQFVSHLSASDVILPSSFLKTIPFTPHSKVFTSTAPARIVPTDADSWPLPGLRITVTRPLTVISHFLSSMFVKVYSAPSGDDCSIFIAPAISVA